MNQNQTIDTREALLAEWRETMADVDRHASALADALRAAESIRAMAEALPEGERMVPHFVRPFAAGRVFDLTGILGFDLLETWRNAAMRAGWLTANKQQARDLQAEDKAAQELAERHERNVKASIEAARKAVAHRNVGVM